MLARPAAVHVGRHAPRDDDRKRHQPEPDRPVYVPIHVALAPDQLPEDDQRYGVVPVVAELPVVFVDQFGDVSEHVGDSYDTVVDAPSSSVIHVIRYWFMYGTPAAGLPSRRFGNAAPPK